MKHTVSEAYEGLSEGSNSLPRKGLGGSTDAVVDGVLQVMDQQIYSHGLFSHCSAKVSA